MFTRRFPAPHAFILAVTAAALMLATTVAAQAAERDRLRAFLEVTGFDVAIISIQQTAMAGPGVAGSDADTLGEAWVRLAEDIFDPDEMIERALDMMEAVMPGDLVEHGAAFYASDLGQRLVAVENESHMAPSDEKYALAEEIVSSLAQEESPRLDQYRAMAEAIGGVDSSVRQVIELQMRYLTAAISAGSLQVDGLPLEDLRQILESQAPEIRAEVEVNSVLGAAYTYRDLSDEDITAYVAALEEPEMRQVYEILNAIQFEIMAERYERLAEALSGLYPQQDI